MFQFISVKSIFLCIFSIYCKVNELKKHSELRLVWYFLKNIRTDKGIVVITLSMLFIYWWYDTVPFDWSSLNFLSFLCTAVLIIRSSNTLSFSSPLRYLVNLENLSFLHLKCPWNRFSSSFKDFLFLLINTGIQLGNGNWI